MTTEIFVYITGKLPCSIGELEEELDEALTGLGEVSGSGVGDDRANIDITSVQSDTRDATERTRQVLTRLGINETAIRFDYPTPDGHDDG